MSKNNFELQQIIFECRTQNAWISQKIWKFAKRQTFKKFLFIRKNCEIEWTYNAQTKHRRNDFENQNFKEKNNCHVMSKSSNTLIYSKLTTWSIKYNISKIFTFFSSYDSILSLFIMLLRWLVNIS